MHLSPTSKLGYLSFNEISGKCCLVLVCKVEVLEYQYLSYYLLEVIKSQREVV